MHQVVLRLCAQILGAWSCKTTTMLADPDNKASLASGAIRLQLPVAVDYAAVPPESSVKRYTLVSDMRRALATLCGIEHYRLLMRDLTPPSTPLANLSEHGLDPEGVGAYATFDVLPATGGGPSPESTARSLQMMLDDPTGTSPFYHEGAATTAARREAYDLFQQYPPVRGATLTQLAEDGTFSARIPPPSPPPPSYPPVPSRPPPREPPPPPSRPPWAEAQHVVRLAFVLSGSVDTFDRAAFTKSLAALLGVEPSAIALEVSAASVRVRATVNAESAEEAADLAATVNALKPDTASAELGVTVESLEDAVACDSSREGSKGCGGGEVIPTADEGDEMPVEYIGGAAALVVISLCVCACLCRKRRRAQKKQQRKLRAAVHENQKKMAQVHVAMRGGGMM